MRSNRRFRFCAASLLTFAAFAPVECFAVPAPKPRTPCEIAQAKSSRCDSKLREHLVECLTESGDATPIQYACVWMLFKGGAEEIKTVDGARLWVPISPEEAEYRMGSCVTEMNQNYEDQATLNFSSGGLAACWSTFQDEKTECQILGMMAEYTCREAQKAVPENEKASEGFEPAKNDSEMAGESENVTY